MYITLKNVLYCLDVTFMLVSLTCCNVVGFSVLLKDWKCLIWDAWGMLLGKITLSNGLYKVESKCIVPTANVTQKVLIPDELHCCMGHISLQVTHRLIHDGTITGLDVDMSSQPDFCMACTQAKSMQKPVPQKQEGPCAMKIQHAVWLKNRSSTHGLDGKTPYKLIHNSKPDLTNLSEFLKEDWGKLKHKADEGRWVGYSDESKGHRVYKWHVTVEHNVIFDEPVLVTMNAQTEGESTTQGSQCTSGTPHGQTPPLQIQTPVTDPAHIDPLEGFKTLEPLADPPKGKGYHLCKPSAYMWGISEGTFSSTSHTNAPTYPQGLPMPTDESALMALLDFEESMSKTQGETDCTFKYSMAATHDMRIDLTNLNNACSHDDWCHIPLKWLVNMWQVTVYIVPTSCAR